jgi:hypothetical protein
MYRARVDLGFSGRCLQRTKTLAKQNVCLFCVKRVLTITKSPHKKVPLFVNPVAFEAIHKRFEAFCEEPGSSQKVTPELCMNSYLNLVL